jgi:hypothetical protein
LIDGHRARTRLTSALVIAALVSCGGAISAGASAPDPAANLQLGQLPPACPGSPVSPACEVALVADLDAGRRALGLGPYDLPVDFPTLAADRQLFILVNLDRRAYSLPLISGLSPQLDAAAGAGAAIEQDPVAPAADRAVWASAWAAGLPNVLDAYYQWMYSDGFAGLNIDCPSPAAPGCWVHRHGILFAFAPSGKLTMGAAVTSDRAGRPVVGMLITDSPRATAPAEDYTWADARADGAGRRSGAAIKASARRPVALPAPRITSSSVSSAARTAAVHFTAGTAARFECALVSRVDPTSLDRRYSTCRSPARYSGLRSGVYDFFVRRLASPTRHSAAAEDSIRIG